MTVIVCDLDGVIWRGDDAIAGSAATVDALRDAGHRVAFVTNNSAMTATDVLAKLERHDISVDVGDVVTSGEAAAALLATMLDPGTPVFVCAASGVEEAVAAAGLVPLGLADVNDAQAVVVGWHRTFDFARLDAASRVARAGHPFVATNIDPTYPAERGSLLPGSGAIVASVATAAGLHPLIAGKPEGPTVDLILARFGNDGIVVGDRPSTDGVLADRLGWPFALVLSGIVGHDVGGEGIPEPRPAIVAEDFARALPELLALGYAGSSGPGARTSGASGD